jgi:hypothetical protein
MSPSSLGYAHINEHVLIDKVVPNNNYTKLLWRMLSKLQRHKEYLYSIKSVGRNLKQKHSVPLSISAFITS